MKYPSGIVKEVAVYQCGTQGSVCAVTVAHGRHQHRELRMNHSQRDLKEIHGPEQCLEDPNIQGLLKSQSTGFIMFFCFVF